MSGLYELIDCKLTTISDSPAGSSGIDVTDTTAASLLLDNLRSSVDEFTVAVIVYSCSL